MGFAKNYLLFACQSKIEGKIICEDNNKIKYLIKYIDKYMIWLNQNYLNTFPKLRDGGSAFKMILSRI